MRPHRNPKSFPLSLAAVLLLFHSGCIGSFLAYGDDDDDPLLEGGNPWDRGGDDDDAGDDEEDLPDTTPPDDPEKKITPEDVEDAICDEASDEAQTFFMSADDSNSQATPVQVRQLLDAGVIPAGNLRIHEFLNYYSFDYEAAEAGTLRIDPQLRPDPEGNNRFSLGVAAVAPSVEPEDRRPIDITFSVDTSCSMGGNGIAASQATMRAVAASLREGDTVSIVRWATETSQLLGGYAVSGPSDPAVLNVIDALETDGTTDLSSGLVAAYDLAAQVQSEGRLNRVILLSDGGANTGETDRNLIAQHAEDAEGEGIYLVGVLTPGWGYNQELMDTVTDLGKGAYLYVPDAEEAEKMFSGERFVSNLELAARNVRLSVTMPPLVVLEEFHGEELSQDPDEVEPQHLAPNDVMLYHMNLVDCGASTSSRDLVFELTWEDLTTGQDRVATMVRSLDELLAAPSLQLLKADAIIAYAEMFAGPSSPELVASTLLQVDQALVSLPGDPDLGVIKSSLERIQAIYSTSSSD